MKKQFIIITTMILGASFLLLGQYGRGNRGGRGQNNNPQQGQQQRGGGYGYLNQLPRESVSTQERQHLIDLREEEKLARDVYVYFSNQLNLKIFERIAESESRHMASIKILLDKYEINDPVGENIPGQFSNPKYQDLYGALISEGEVSIGHAIKVGAKIEDMDIFDLERALDVSDNQDIRTLYQNLAKGSRNHLRSFITQLQILQLSYAPQYISLDMFESIINSPWERGPYDADGQPRPRNRGAGRGLGSCQYQSVD